MTETCPYSKKCGGCDYIGIPYEKQLAKKQSRISRLLGNEAKAAGCRIEPILGAEQPLYYRNKVHSVFTRDRRRIIRGIYRAGTHEVISVSGCLLEDPTADAVMETILTLLPKFKLEVFDEDTGRGFFRHVLVRTAQHTDRKTGRTRKELMVVLVTADPRFPGKANFIKALRAAHPEITTIVQNINRKKTSMVLGDRSITLCGKGYLVDSGLGLDFRISPTSFFQIHPGQTKVLYGLACEMAGLTGKERVLDAYCGTGTIGMFLAKDAGEVVGIERNREAVRDACANAKANRILNIRFICADATDCMKKMAAERRGGAPAFDVLCMDPPRTGSTPEFIRAVSMLRIPRVVYVSCGPETLAADLKCFRKYGYRIERIAPVDMFPQTVHVETVVLMSRKEK